jgi:hypothetical protein
VNWPYSPRDVLLHSVPPKNAQANTDEPYWHMNPVFEAHIMNLENWSLGSAFAEQFPDWAGVVNIKENELGLGKITV